MHRPLSVLVAGAGIAGPELAYWLNRRGHRPVLVERMGLGEAVRDARTRIMTLSVVRSDGIDPADRPAQCDLLRRRFSGMGWETPRLLDALDGAYDYYFDEMAQVRMPRWSSGRIGLLGDAAFGPSPLSGQGTSLALIGGHFLGPAPRLGT